MTRRFEFTADHQGQTDFAVIYTAFLGRGSDSNNPKRQQQTKADHLIEAKISKALKAISEPIGEPIENATFDTRPRRLKDSGGIIELEQSQFSRLLKFIEDTQWTPNVVEQAVDTMERFETADKVN